MRKLYFGIARLEVKMYFSHSLDWHFATDFFSRLTFFFVMNYSGLVLSETKQQDGSFNYSSFISRPNSLIIKPLNVSKCSHEKFKEMTKLFKSIYACHAELFEKIFICFPTSESYPATKLLHCDLNSYEFFLSLLLLISLVIFLVGLTNHEFGASE